MPSLVSLIVRSTDRPTLDETLGSIAAQTYPVIEVLVVNAKGHGHSALPETVGRHRLRRIDADGPLGRSPAANAGLRAAEGRYIGFVDDDDLILPEHVHLLAYALEHGSIPVAYSGARMDVFAADGTLARSVVMNQPFHKPSLRAQNYLPIHSVLFERRLVEVGCAFDETLSHYEDWDFWLQLAEYADFHHVDAITAVYRNYGHSGFGLEHDCDTVNRGRTALFAKWGARWSGEQLAEAFAAVIDGTIHRQDPGLEAWAMAQYAAREAAEADRDRLSRAGDDWRKRAEDLAVDLKESRQALEAARIELARSQAENSRLTASLSWRIAAPLRRLRRWLSVLR